MEITQRLEQLTRGRSERSEGDDGSRGTETSSAATGGEISVDAVDSLGQAAETADAASEDGATAQAALEEEEEGEELLVDPIPKDVQFDILKNRRRRLVLRYLLDNEGPVRLGTLSEHVAGIENDKDPRMLDSQERKRVYVGLYQCHLPRMADAGVIEFNKNRGLISLGPHAEVLETHLETGADDDVPWEKVYLLTALGGLGAYLLTHAPLVPGDWLGSAVLLGTLGLVLVISMTQLRSEPDED